MLYAAPVVLIALYGALWITLHAGGGRGSAHTLRQSLALAETVLALLLRARKPAGALAGILAVYLFFSLDPLLLPAALLALLTVATIRDHRTVAIATTATAAALAATPYIHGDPVSFTGYSLPRLAAAGAAVAPEYTCGRGKIAGPSTPAERPAGEPAGAAPRLTSAVITNVQGAGITVTGDHHDIAAADDAGHRSAEQLSRIHRLG
ncbi:MAG TPA: hypothetical protein VGH77_00835 [Streptosporangiaceae bacterium]|jgi:hypothetical protein